MTVGINSRMVNLDEPVSIGVAQDNAVTVVAFKGVEALNADDPQAQTVIMKWATTSGDPKAGDVIPLTYESGLWQFTVEATLTQFAGRAISAYVRATTTDGKVWSTYPFIIKVESLPDLDGVLVPQSITAIDACLNEIAAHRADMDAHTTAMNETLTAAQGAASDALTTKGDVEAMKQAVEAFNTAVEGLTARAEMAAGGAEASDADATAKAAQAAQALSDLLRMLGQDIAPLVGGVIPLEYLSPRLIVRVRVRASEAEMLSLDAQEADVCIRTDEAKTYIMDETGAWVHMPSPTNYADTAGHAATADSAEDAAKINGQRWIKMTQSQFDVAAASDTLDDSGGTFYTVIPD